MLICLFLIPEVANRSQLHPLTRESELMDMFRPYGSLKEISIRVARGDTANYDAMSKGATMQNTRIYAVITFNSIIHARKALVMNGLRHRGMPMVVRLFDNVQHLHHTSSLSRRSPVMLQSFRSCKKSRSAREHESRMHSKGPRSSGEHCTRSSELRFYRVSDYAQRHVLAGGLRPSGR